MYNNSTKSIRTSLADTKGKRREAVQHIQSILGITKEECEEYIKYAFTLWNERNQ